MFHLAVEGRRLVLLVSRRLLMLLIPRFVSREISYRLVKMLVSRLRRAVMFDVGLVTHFLELFRVLFAPLMGVEVVFDEIAFRLLHLCLLYTLRGLMWSYDVFKTGDINVIEIFSCSIIVINCVFVYVCRCFVE